MLATDSENPSSLAFLGQTALYRWDYDEAEEYHLHAFHVDPTNIWAHLFHPTVALYRGQLEEAAERIQAARQLMPDDPWLQSCEALLLPHEEPIRLDATLPIPPESTGNTETIPSHVARLWK
jgi:predicted Zn-dependent protease